MNSNEEKQALNLDGRIATPEEIAAGLSTKNAFDMCQVKLGRSLSYEELSADIPQYDGASPEIAYDYAHGVYNKENEVAYNDGFGWRPSGKMKKITGSDLKIIQAATGKLKQQAR